jgi:hypothetical protein
LASSAFARHYLRNHGCFLFLWVLRCFTSPRSLLLPYVFRQRSPDITPVSFEVSLFGDPRIEARLPAPRGLSQVTTSFIGSWCLGIHRLPLVACCTTKMLASTVKFSTHGRHTPHQTRKPAAVVRTESPPTEVSEPSGPNSVLRPTHHPHRLSTPLQAEVVLTAHTMRRLNSQCSTIPVPDQPQTFVVELADMDTPRRACHMAP